MESILNSFAWKAFNWLPSFLLRKIFNEEWFKKNIYIDIKPRHSSVEILQPENPRVTIQLEIRNQTHFPIELDRLLVKFIYGIEIAKPNHFKRELIKSGETKNLYLYGNIEANQFGSLAFQHKNNSNHCYIEVWGEFNSKIHCFSTERKLDGIKPEIANVHTLNIK